VPTLPAILQIDDRILAAAVAATGDPTSPLHGFGPDLAVTAPDWRDLVAPPPIGALAAEVDAALDGEARLFATLWDQLTAPGTRIVQYIVVPTGRAQL
jgi:hypothetical protein